MVGLMVHSADIQDRDGAPDLLKSSRSRWPWLLHVFADGGYAGDELKRRLQKIGKWALQTIKRSDKTKGFELLPRRWVVERTFAWRGRCRRLTKDFEKSIASAESADHDRPHPYAHQKAGKIPVSLIPFRVRLLRYKVGPGRDLALTWARRASTYYRLISLAVLRR